jgi:hypothetical protein
MKISIETSPYNDRRYSAPWIARVDFSTNNQGEFKWGEFIGDRGAAGLLEVEAEPGDVIARGQKDHRKPRNSAPDWYIVKPDGSLEAIDGRATALKHFRTTKTASV